MDEIFWKAVSHDAGLANIDLHNSKNTAEALDQLEKELFFIFKKGEKYCRIIYGIGEGVLREKALNYIKKHPLIIEYKEEDSGGSVIVIF